MPAQRCAGTFLIYGDVQNGAARDAHPFGRDDAGAGGGADREAAGDVAYVQGGEAFLKRDNFLSTPTAAEDAVGQHGNGFEPRVIPACKDIARQGGVLFARKADAIGKIDLRAVFRERARGDRLILIDGVHIAVGVFLGEICHEAVIGVKQPLVVVRQKGEAVFRFGAPDRPRVPIAHRGAVCVALPDRLPPAQCRAEHDGMGRERGEGVVQLQNPFCIVEIGFLGPDKLRRVQHGERRAGHRAFLNLGVHLFIDAALGRKIEIPPHDEIGDPFRALCKIAGALVAAIPQKQRHVHDRDHHAGHGGVVGDLRRRTVAAAPQNRTCGGQVGAQPFAQHRNGKFQIVLVPENAKGVHQNADAVIDLLNAGGVKGQGVFVDRAAVYRAVAAARDDRQEIFHIAAKRLTGAVVAHIPQCGKTPHGVLAEVEILITAIGRVLRLENVSALCRFADDVASVLLYGKAGAAEHGTKRVVGKKAAVRTRFFAVKRDGGVDAVFPRRERGGVEHGGLPRRRGDNDFVPFSDGGETKGLPDIGGGGVIIQRRDRPQRGGFFERLTKTAHRQDAQLHALFCSFRLSVCSVKLRQEFQPHDIMSAKKIRIADAVAVDGIFDDAAKVVAVGAREIKQEMCPVCRAVGRGRGKLPLPGVVLFAEKAKRQGNAAGADAVVFHGEIEGDPAVLFFGFQRCAERAVLQPAARRFRKGNGAGIVGHKRRFFLFCDILRF